MAYSGRSCAEPYSSAKGWLHWHEADASHGEWAVDALASWDRGACSARVMLRQVGD
jgi:hypothetical protein